MWAASFCPPEPPYISVILNNTTTHIYHYERKPSYISIIANEVKQSPAHQEPSKSLISDTPARDPYKAINNAPGGVYFRQLGFPSLLGIDFIQKSTEAEKQPSPHPSHKAKEYGARASPPASRGSQYRLDLFHFRTE